MAVLCTAEDIEAPAMRRSCQAAEQACRYHLCSMLWGAHLQHGERAHEEGVVGGDAELELVHGPPEVRAQVGEADVADAARQGVGEDPRERGHHLVPEATTPTASGPATGLVKRGSGRISAS